MEPPTPSKAFSKKRRTPTSYSPPSPTVSTPRPQPEPPKPPASNTSQLRSQNNPAKAHPTGLRRSTLKSLTPIVRQSRSNMIRTAEPEHPSTAHERKHDHSKSHALSCSPLPFSSPHRRSLCPRTGSRPIHPHPSNRCRHPVAARLRRHHRQRDPPPHRLYQ